VSPNPVIRDLRTALEGATFWWSADGTSVMVAVRHGMARPRYFDNLMTAMDKHGPYAVGNMNDVTVFHISDQAMLRALVKEVDETPDWFRELVDARTVLES
jgi:hypothetical protein